MTVPWPPDGLFGWSDELKAYIDAVGVGGDSLDPNTAALIQDETSESRSAIDSAFDDVFTDYAPGTELGYASRNTSFTTTNVSGTAGGEIPSLSMTIVGSGRPADIRFNAAAVYHSVANTSVNAGLLVNGTVVSSFDAQLAGVLSPLTNGGPSLSFNRRILLTDGVSYTFGIRVFGGAAGTCSLVAAGYCPMELSAVSR